MRPFFGVQAQKIDSRSIMWLGAIAETILAFLIALGNYSQNTLINELQYSCVLWVVPAGSFPQSQSCSF